MFLDKPIVIRDLFSTLARLTAHEEPAARAPSPKRVLVMDDSLLILEATRDALASALSPHRDGNAFRLGAAVWNITAVRP